MTFTVEFIERKVGETNSIETVFRQVSKGLSKLGVNSHFTQVPFENSIVDIVKNLLFFRKGKADIYHVTGHIQYIAILLGGINSVMTVHDMRTIHTPNGLRRYLLKKLIFDWPCSRAKMVTTISEATRRELIELTKCPPEKIRVIENPLREGFVSEKMKPFDEGCPVILQVGTSVVKNLVRTAEALNGIKCKFRILGTLSDEDIKALEKIGIEYDSVAGISDDELKQEYLNADLVTFCSTFEGFGLPIIEAQATGTPLVTSNVSPMKEVAGEGAVLIDPLSVESIRNGVRSIINDPDKREELVREGYKNVERFSYESVAAKYAELYREMLA